MHSKEALLKKTKHAYLWTRIFNIPFWALLSMLSLILYKELHVGALQMAIFVALKPLSALFATYWSAYFPYRKNLLFFNLVCANILRYLPFLFFPWIDSAWLMVFAFGIYMMMNRAVVPAWMEIFNRNIEKGAREQVVAYGSSLDYIGPALLPLLIGAALDDYNINFRWLFFGTGLLGLISTFFLFRIPTVWRPSEGETAKEKVSFRETVLKPWKQSWDLIKLRPDFGKYQVGFMLGGAGLMVMLATQTMFFVDVLHLTYTEMALAIALCKGVGFVAASPLWVRFFRKVDIYFFSGLVTFLAALFPFLLLLSQGHILFLYVAFLLYGSMQAGSELSWHMSGPIFSKDKDSSLYSQTNVLAIGMRGLVAPFTGSLLYTLGNSYVALFFGSFLCFLATRTLFSYSKNPFIAKVESN